MTTSSQAEALRAYWQATPAVRTIILQHAEQRAKAVLDVHIALQQRLVQVTALLFVAAAFSTQFTFNARVTTPYAAAICCSSVVSFATGAVLGLLGSLARAFTLPGDRPSWWADAANMPSFNDDTPKYWLAGRLEEAIEEIEAASWRRSWYMNRALSCGVLGAVLFAVSIIAAVLL